MNHGTTSKCYFGRQIHQQASLSKNVTKVVDSLHGHCSCVVVHYIANSTIAVVNRYTESTSLQHHE